FSYDITSALNDWGEMNVVAVRCDNSEEPNSRWYAGCGIYRNVRLICTQESYVVYDGVYVTTPRVEEKSATVHVEARVAEGPFGEHRVVFGILDSEGRKVAEAEAEHYGLDESEMVLNDSEYVGQWSSDIELASPHRWDLDDTYLYTVVVDVYAEDKLMDSYSREFGIRTIDWNADKGFFLNGEAVKLLGVCLHHDMGCIGTAVHPRALERELMIMKEMGVNAIRTSHNPPAPQLLDLCDRMGFLVMDEAFDMWRQPKKEFDYSKYFDNWHERDLRAFIKRDRNHPCVVMWSIGNEIPEQRGEDGDGISLTGHLVEILREMDDTRYVTSGCDAVFPGNNLFRSGALDGFGINYHPQMYDSMRVWFPDKRLIGSETASSFNSRGVYYQPSSDVERLSSYDEQYQRDHANQCNGYDALCAQWGNTHEEAWKAVRDRDYIAGTFVWTGFDYLGEPTPYWWPSRSSYFGIVDLAGFPKDQYYLYQSEWTDKKVLHLFPHWNWSPGDSVDVVCYYSQADEVELLVNGKSVGRSAKTRDMLHAQWLKVPWEPGKIEAVAYRDGSPCARTVRYTAGKPVSLKLTPDRQRISSDGYDLSYVTVEAFDAEGKPVPTASDMLHFTVTGAGELFGVDNGNAADTLSLKGCNKQLFNGKALAVVRSLKGERGTAILTVSSEWGTASTGIRVR
ncbi:MAG: DUF4982 domain-containing protein, partial [Alistipes sp.]|nr:DUF4982 domain-containing protein [Candidatus Minthomonas equi]